jgi:hypothetical protein
MERSRYILDRDVVYFPSTDLSLVERGVQIRWGAVKGMRIVTAGIATTSGALTDEIVAHGNSDSSGCRVVVNGLVKAVKTSNEVRVHRHRLVKSA